MSEIVVKKKKKKFKVFPLVNGLIFILISLIILLPMWKVIVDSFDARAGYGMLFWPQIFTIDGYKEVITNSVLYRPFLISVFVTAVGSLLGLTLSTLGAYVLIQYEMPGRNFFANMLLFTMIFNGGMIPTYIVVKNLHLLNTIWALILPGAVPVFSVILLMNFFKGVPKALEEAAIIDEASQFQVLLQIMVPCAKPSIATVSLFSIVGSWNDFFGGLIYMQRVEDYPIMTYIQSLNIDLQELVKNAANSAALENVAELSNRNLNAAKIVVAVIPLLLIYPFLQRYLISGLVMGSVKE